MGSPTSSRLKPVMETDRLFLRDWDPPNDAEAAFLLYGDPSVVRHLHMPPQASIETQRDALTQIQAEVQQTTDSYGPQRDDCARIIAQMRVERDATRDANQDPQP